MKLARNKHFGLWRVCHDNRWAKSVKCGMFLEGSPCLLTYPSRVGRRCVIGLSFVGWWPDGLSLENVPKQRDRFAGELSTHNSCSPNPVSQTENWGAYCNWEAFCARSASWWRSGKPRRRDRTGESAVATATWHKLPEDWISNATIAVSVVLSRREQADSVRLPSSCNKSFINVPSSKMQINVGWFTAVQTLHASWSSFDVLISESVFWRWSTKSSVRLWGDNEFFLCGQWTSVRANDTHSLEDRHWLVYS